MRTRTKLGQCQIETAELLRVGKEAEAYVHFDPAIIATVNCRSRGYLTGDRVSILMEVRERFPAFETESQQAYVDWLAGARETDPPQDLLKLVDTLTESAKEGYIEDLTVDQRTDRFCRLRDTGFLDGALEFARPSMTSAIKRQRSKYGHLTEEDLQVIEDKAWEKISAKIHDYDSGKSNLNTWVKEQVRGVSSPHREKKFPRQAKSDYFDRILPATEKLSEQLGREPTDGEIAEECGLSVKRVIEVKAQIIGKNNPVWIDGPASREWELSAVDDEEIQEVRRILEELPDYDSSVLKLRDGIGMTFEEMTRLRIFPSALPGIEVLIAEARRQSEGKDGELARELTSDECQGLIKAGYPKLLTDGEKLVLHQYPKDPKTMSAHHGSAQDRFRALWDK